MVKSMIGENIERTWLSKNQARADQISLTGTALLHDSSEHNNPIRSPLNFGWVLIEVRATAQDIVCPTKTTWLAQHSR